MIESSLIEAISPTLQAISSIYAGSTQSNDPEDVYQEMVLKLLERAAVSPDFTQQNISYITHAARLRAWNLARDCAVHAQFEVTMEDDPESDDPWYEAFSDGGLSPEEALIQKEETLETAQMLRSLSSRESEVMSMVIAGVSTSEIASELGCSAPAVCTYRNRAIEKLRNQLAS